MNRFQHDGIDSTITEKRREIVLNKTPGINHRMSTARRKKKHERHAANAITRHELSASASRK
jgi:hypothetical protein